MNWKTTALALFSVASAALPSELPVQSRDILILPHAGSVKSVSFEPDGKVLWTRGCADPHCVKKGDWGWDIQNLREAVRPQPWTGGPPTSLPGRHLEISPQEFEEALFVALSPDQRLLAVGGAGPQLRIMDVETRVPLKVLQPDEEALETFRQTIGDELALMASGQWHSRLQPAVRAAAFSPDSKVVVAAITMALGMGIAGSQLWIWDLESKRPLCQPILCRFSTGSAGFVEAAALAVHPTAPLVAVSLSTPGEKPQSRLGEVQLIELPACFPHTR